MRKCWLLLRLCVGFVVCGAVGANAADRPLFASSDVLDITIEGPLKTLIGERSNEDYYDGELRYADRNGVEQVLDLKFRTRGNYRRQKATCRFPPVRLNFRRKQVEGTVFEGQNILKLVTHCRPGSGRYEEYVLREELAYRILKLHTDASFRTRLLRIEWIDSERNGRSETRYGFVIEHSNELEARLGMREPGYDRTRYQRLNLEQASVAALFEYQIANTDFSMVSAAEGRTCCHNGILLEREPDDLYFVPYDFDMAGIVDAPYATPNPRFKLRGVTERLYRGHCRFNDTLDAAAGRFRENRDAVIRMVADQPGLADRTRRRLTDFLGDFYKQIDSERGMAELKEACRGRAD